MESEELVELVAYCNCHCQPVLSLSSSSSLLISFLWNKFSVFFDLTSELFMAKSILRAEKKVMFRTCLAKLLICKILVLQ